MPKQKILLKEIPGDPGIVRGKTRIILDPKECKKIKKEIF